MIEGQDKAIESADHNGGQGDTSLLGDPHRAQSDCKMIGRAIRERWPTTDRIKAKIVSRAEACVDDPMIDPETFCSVGRLVLGMESQNQADDHLEDKNARLDSGKATENCGVVFNIVPVGGTPNESTQKG